MTQIELQERIAGKVEGILRGKVRMQNARIAELRARAGSIHERGSERWQEVRAEESGPDNDTGADDE